MSRPFQIVDVFSDAPFLGNPLAVIAEADDLSLERMQAITRWLNHSETTFLLPPADPAADYRVRIFTLDRELPFAGHPTLGTCHAWLKAGGIPKNPDRIVQECGAGLIPIRRVDGRLAFAAPPLMRDGPVAAETLAEVLAFLRLAPEAVVEARWIDNGPGWLGIMLADADAVLAVDAPRAHARRIEVGLVGAHSPGGSADYEIRALFSDQHGAVREDPVTGSLNASVAQWLRASGRVSGPYVAAQGQRIGHAGRIHVTYDGEGQAWIGGGVATLFSGAADF